jgi:hypothetical protein
VSKTKIDEKRMRVIQTKVGLENMEVVDYVGSGLGNMETKLLFILTTFSDDLRFQLLFRLTMFSSTTVQIDDVQFQLVV